MKNFLQLTFFCDILRMLQKNTYADFSDGAQAGNTGRSQERKHTEDQKPNGGKKHECYFNETAFRSRCSLWTSDKKMEPENGSVHLIQREMVFTSSTCRNL